MKVTSLYLCPWSLNDPLCQSQSLAYIKRLVSEGYSFALITFENSKFLMSADKIEEAKKKLQNEGIYWYPVYWNSGNSVLSKVLSIYSAIFTGLRTYLKHKPKLIHSRSSLPLFLALFLVKIGSSKFLYDADSILSEEYADVGHLRRTSLGFRLIAWSESTARRSADQIIVLTQTLKEDFIFKYGVQKDIKVIPCCVDTIKFAFSKICRVAKRSELSIGNELLFIYVGKFGTWYLVEQMIDFFKTALTKDNSVKLLIITQESPEVFENILIKEDIKSSSYFIRRADPAEVTEWLSAADIGLAFIKPLVSKRGSSPVKTSEYLASGLPIVSSAGVGDLDKIIRENNVGVIVPQFTQDSYYKAFENAQLLLASSNLREHCSQTAFREFDLYTVGGDNYNRIYKDVL